MSCTKIFGCLLVTLMLMGSGIVAIAQHKDEIVVKMLADFYTKYITIVAESAGNNMEKTLDAMRRQHCTKRLLKRLPGIIEQTGADPFLDAQDANIEFLKSLVVTKNAADKNGYTVQYMDAYNSNQTTVNIDVVDDEGEYKIDNIH